MAPVSLMVCIIVVVSHLDFINCRCLQDWTEVDGQCFQVPRDPTASNTNNRMQLDHVAARDHCLTLEADLAQPDNLLDMAAYLRTIPGLDDYDHIWLCGSDAQTEGIFRWCNGSIVNKSDWKHGQPDSRDGLNQDCLYMMSAELLKGHVLGDEVCQGDKQHFVCERTPEKIGCVYGFKCYVDGAILNDACLAFECTEGNWKYLVESIQECRNCTVQGDPHIYTYEEQLSYTSPGGFDGEFAISQQGKVYDPLFGVSAIFTQCDNGNDEMLRNVTCVSRVTYTEPGITVELILPVKVYTIVSPEDVPTVLYCQKDNRRGYGPPPAANDPLCATKIKVNGEKTVIDDNGSVTSFYGTGGTVLIFKVGECDSYKCQIFVVGSQGITVGLEIDPNPPSTYYLRVYPTPSLRNKLYGLCDTFTGTDTDHYTPRYGPPITIWSENLDEFVDTWKIGACSCEFRENVDFEKGCVITEAAPADEACQCTLVKDEVNGIPEHICFGFVVACEDLSSSHCTHPNTGYESCLQGQGKWGNCGGYGPYLLGE